MENIRLNVSLLRRRVPNLTSAARDVGLRPATVSNLCTGKIPVGRAEVRTMVALAELAQCSLDELILRGENVEMIETKIKTLDLFAPIVKGRNSWIWWLVQEWVSWLSWLNYFIVLRKRVMQRYY